MVKSYRKKEALMQGIEKALAEAANLGFHSASIGVKSTFFCFPKMALVKMIHQKPWTVYRLKALFDYFSQTLS